MDEQTLAALSEARNMFYLKAKEQYAMADAFRDRRAEHIKQAEAFNQKGMLLDILWEKMR